MTTRMLIDARHREETRVAVVKGKQIEEFDFESAEHQQLKGNIYLAKVTRVEPSLQAAFVDYGGNRHGFLAFSEIHPDYYQIPKEDRERLIAEEQEAAAEEALAREAEEDAGDMSRAPSDDGQDRDVDSDELVEIDTDTSIDTIDQSEGELPDLDDDKDTESGDEDGSEETSEGDDNNGSGRGRSRRGRGGKGGGRGNGNVAKKSDSARAKRIALRRRYKIQDVIHRRQVMLVQVVKEERGNKGAALTTYLSLAGRYCVLMPNTSHGGGISRKISSAADRKRLKSIVGEMQLPATMGCIIRTAGLSRTKTEIKRDFDYLARLWDEIREQTLKASAPQLIHSDSDLVKRAIRDIYNRDIEEVMVEGEDGYRAAKDFMKLLMPSHARRVKHYADPVPLFQRYGVEDQLSAMYHPVVQLKSGGYIVINPTEALVSIDINSGRSTKEHGIEQTALSTNLEAAREIARQLRLRDMAGLIVIDFIDMENNSNSRKVERAMKEALKSDRARIQVGRISSFGLMEMSRQRLRTGVLEASTRECPHCEGTGLVRTASSSALSALRLLEEEAAKGKGSFVTLSASQEAAIYVLNNKRTELAEIEARYGVSVEIVPTDESEGAKMTVSSAGPKPEKRATFEPIQEVEEQEEDEPIVEDESEDDRRSSSSSSSDDEGEGRSRGKRRRRGRRGGRGRKNKDNRQQDNEGNAQSEDENQSSTDDKQPEQARSDDERAQDAQSEDVKSEDRPAEEAADEKAGKKRRAPRRARKSVDEADALAESGKDGADEAKTEANEEKPKRPRRSRAKKAASDDSAKAADADEASKEKPVEEKSKRRRASSAKKADSSAKAGAEAEKADAAEAGAKPVEEKPAKAPEKAAQTAPMPKPQTVSAERDDGGEADDGDDDGSPRRGWWQRTFGN